MASAPICIAVFSNLPNGLKAHTDDGYIIGHFRFSFWINGGDPLIPAPPRSRSHWKMVATRFHPAPRARDRHYTGWKAKVTICCRQRRW